ncbi:unnamed protein product [Echinostoma caproni]|uniref:BTB domain-containing protein n=1 Tax=Echinostoma caproni TaxID=27848 RepID=A0A183A625_9TREM|nr:unnamed protein product [Echinostoma caproni]
MSDSILLLNVGGVHYATTMETIQHYPNSYLNRLLMSKDPLKDENGRLFIDRDGKLFRYILDYCRYGRASLPTHLKELNRLKEEAIFYGLDEMICQLEDMISLDPRWNSQLSSCITIGYRGTFGASRDGTTDLRFRKLARILVAGQTLECRRVFGDALNVTRDPDTGSSYSSRFFLKHTILEQAFDLLYQNGYELVTCCASGTSASNGDIKFGQDEEEPHSRKLCQKLLTQAHIHWVWMQRFYVWFYFSAR